MKRAVGAIVAYDDPEHGRSVLLQVRKDTDSFPACVEKTWGGGAEEGESLSQAVCREYGEELRECFARANTRTPDELTMMQKPATTNDVESTSSDALDRGAGYTLSRLNVLRDEGKKLVVTLLCSVHDSHIIANAQPLVDAGVLVSLRAEQVDQLVPIEGKHKLHGLTPEERTQGKLGMFPDEIAAVRKALELDA